MNLLLLLLLKYTFLATSQSWKISTVNDSCPCPAAAPTQMRSQIQCAMYSGVIGCDVFQYENGWCHVPLHTENHDRQHRAFVRPPSRGRAEVARGKPVTASSVYRGLLPSRAVDGNETTKFHSDGGRASDQPWIVVDLGTCVPVDKFRIMPQADTHAYRFVHVSLGLGDEMPAVEGNFSSYSVVGTFDKLPTKENAWYDFEIDPPRCSRYAAVFKNKEMEHPYYFLEIREMQIWVSY